MRCGLNPFSLEVLFVDTRIGVFTCVHQIDFSVVFSLDAMPLSCDALASIAARLRSGEPPRPASRPLGPVRL